MLRSSERIYYWRNFLLIRAEDYFYFREDATDEEAEIEEEELNVGELLQTFPPEYLKMLPKNFLSEFQKFETIDDLVTYLKETLNSIHKKGFHIRKKSGTCIENVIFSLRC